MNGERDGHLVFPGRDRGRNRALQLLDQGRIAALDQTDLRQGLQGNHPAQFQIVDFLLQPLQRLTGIVERLRRQLSLSALTGALYLLFQLGQQFGPRFLDIFGTGHDEGLEHLHLVEILAMQTVEHGDVALEDFLLALQFDGDPVDLGRNSGELGFESFDLGLQPAENSLEETEFIEAFRVKPLDLQHHVTEQVTDRTGILVQGFRQNTVGECRHFPLCRITERDQLGPVGEVDLALDLGHQRHVRAESGFLGLRRGNSGRGNGWHGRLGIRHVTVALKEIIENHECDRHNLPAFVWRGNLSRQKPAD